ncbi:Single-stranded DNA-binding protein [Mycoplasmopsis bovigenitalium 51080]|uniref:Single-stranded DNA-binding protein n=1 Tax=Mycoplasmopsis bovigenitalium 51080 TaxID=1188235 RepID=N9VEL5_9BACT|nr:single-stranded DNA-binding protein [Mycoplasmopsis bovigenitalium]ENY69856.1 Single-stranded DNA-binding protein [Mycoplasmopsis bovigenitalium 51080]
MNKVLLTGRIASDTLKEHRKENSLWVRFNLAVIDQGINKVKFIDINLFNKVAENYLKYCKKGDLIEVIGKIDTSYYIAKDTQKKKYKLDVIGHQITFLAKSHKQKENKENNENNETQENEYVFPIDKEELNVNIFGEENE